MASKGFGSPAKTLAAVVVDGGGLAVHQAIRADDVSTIDLADGLVTEADTEYGGGRAELADEFDGDARLVWCAGTGGNADFLRGEGFHFIDGEGVVTENFHLHAKLAKVLDEVVGEGIVVV